MTGHRLRLAVLSLSLAVLGASLGWAVGGLPAFGTFTSAYGRIADTLIPRADHIPEIVSGITYDMRAFDSLGETFILFASVLGVALLLREREDRGDERPRDAATGDTIRFLGIRLIPVLVVVGLWDGTTAGLSPGNGFQVGVILAAATLLLWAAGSYRAFRRATPPQLLDGADGTGAAGIVAVGLAGLASGGVFLQQFIDPGPPGTIYSGGIVLLFSWCVALEVAAANVLLAHEFLEEYVPQLPEAPQR